MPNVSDISEFLKSSSEELDILRRAYLSLAEMKSSGYLDKIIAQVKSEEKKLKIYKEARSLEQAL